MPIKSGLFRRNVVHQPVCELCDAAREDCLHALWSCPSISQVWACIPEFLSLSSQAYYSFSALFRIVLDKASSLLPEKLALVAWLLWNKRNQSRLNLPNEGYQQIWPRAQLFFQEFLTVHQNEKLDKPLTVPVKWHPPPFNWFKVNFDGALFKETNEGGIEVVICDNASQVIATLSQRIQTSPVYGDD